VNRQITYLQRALKLLAIKVKVTHYYDAQTVTAVKTFNKACPGVKTWPGLAWGFRQAACLNYYLSAKGK